MRKTGHVIFCATLVAVSGLRIGGSDDMLQIGGADLTAIKHPVTRQPYIPGSSIKGKIRSELEKRDGRFGGRNGSEPCGCGECLICRIFGPHKNLRHNLGPTRIIVRDAQPLKPAALESKTSTMIDRQTGTAAGGSLRTEERVAAGAEFGMEIGIQLFDIDKHCEYTQDKDGSKTRHKGDDALLVFVLDGIKLLGRTGLGSGIGKGSGQIRIKDPKRFDLSNPIASLDEWPLSQEATQA